MDKRNAEITIAQKIGELRQLILSSLLKDNLSYDKAVSIAEERVEEFFNSLDNAYRCYNSENS